MPKATQLLECRRLCDAVSALGGVVPAQIPHLLDYSTCSPPTTFSPVQGPLRARSGPS